MITPSTPGCRQPTNALRSGSVDQLVSELATYLEASEPTLEQDYRDVLTGLPPFLDCAARLHANPVEVFDRASAGRTPPMVELAGRFSRRTDIILTEWEWELVEQPDGPCYRLVKEVSEEEFRRWYEANIPRDI